MKQTKDWIARLFFGLYLLSCYGEDPKGPEIISGSTSDSASPLLQAIIDNNPKGFEDESAWKQWANYTNDQQVSCLSTALLNGRDWAIKVCLQKGVNFEVVVQSELAGVQYWLKSNPDLPHPDTSDWDPLFRESIAHEDIPGMIENFQSFSIQSSAIASRAMLIGLGVTDPQKQNEAMRDSVTAGQRKYLSLVRVQEILSWGISAENLKEGEDPFLEQVSSEEQHAQALMKLSNLLGTIDKKKLYTQMANTASDGHWGANRSLKSVQAEVRHVINTLWNFNLESQQIGTNASHTSEDILFEEVPAQATTHKTSALEKFWNALKWTNYVTQSPSWDIFDFFMGTNADVPESAKTAQAFYRLWKAWLSLDGLLSD